MLRRPATVITLTAEDIIAYESNRQQRNWQQQQQQGHNDSYMTEPVFSQSQDTVEQRDPRLDSVFLLVYTESTGQKYALEDNYSPENWFDQFNFFTEGDPTNGHVQYVNQTWAEQNGLISVNSQSHSVYMGVDHTNTYKDSGRPSVRLQSKKLYNHGLFVLDLNHMPVGCGTWPAWWTLGQSAEWPAGGEIDIIEGVNDNLNNTNKIYSGTGCSITGKGQTAIADSFDCSQGCGSASTRSDSYGDGFNKANGGVYAMEWTSQWIRVWFFPRSKVPRSLGTDSPDISEFGTPTANFQGGCDIDRHFKDHAIIFDITFCGDWAGPTFGRYADCPMTDSNAWTSCNNFVSNSPESFKNAYWDVNSMRVFQKGSGEPPANNSPVSLLDAVPLSTSVGVPLGKSHPAPASSVKPSSVKPDLNHAGDADQHQTATSPGAFFANAAGVSSGHPQRPVPLPPSSAPSPSNGRNSGPASAPFRTETPQPSCTPISGYDGTGQIGYRHGIGSVEGGLAMCRGNCADSHNCTAVLYTHYKGDFGSPLGYWDCWWGALKVGSVLCGSDGKPLGGGNPQSGGNPQGGGSPPSGNPQSSPKPQGGGNPQGSGKPPAGENPQSGGNPQGSGKPSGGETPQAGGNSGHPALVKKQDTDTSPSPNMGLRDQDFHVFMSKGGVLSPDLSSPAAVGTSSPDLSSPGSSGAWLSPFSRTWSPVPWLVVSSGAWFLIFGTTWTLVSGPVISSRTFGTPFRQLAFPSLVLSLLPIA
ncbi:putative endo-1 [Lasiodiplodia hormozganensis]|uniref:endo-1,3(4)-beta-glucanase n=1 Tax=Lasiodiplodia hormozganensis TaxID=869390 RepID=A0AA40D5C0_9PEZI|nr:putative endo-1 [Lasiodiplodia hormozganensis]